MMHKNTKIQGFSLIELLIAMAIIGILVAVAVPQYRGSIANSRLVNAKNNLRAIYMKQQEFMTNNNVYYGTGACGDDAAAINAALFSGQNIIQDPFFTYCVTQVTTDDFTAQATDSNSGDTYTIDNTNTTNF